MERSVRVAAQTAARNGGLGFVGVFSQTSVFLHHRQGGGVHVSGADRGAAEDFIEVRMGGFVEVRAVLRCYTQNHGVGGQGFALAFGHVFRQLVHHVADDQHRLAAVGQGAVGGAAVGARGHAEGGVARGAVGGGGDEVRSRAALAFEQHVAPAAVRAAGCFGEGGRGNSNKQGTEQEFFHGFTRYAILGR